MPSTSTMTFNTVLIATYHNYLPVIWAITVAVIFNFKNTSLLLPRGNVTTGLVTIFMANNIFKSDLRSLLMAFITAAGVFLLILNTHLLQLIRTPPDISSVMMVHVSRSSREQHWIAGPVMNTGVPYLMTKKALMQIFAS